MTTQQSHTFARRTSQRLQKSVPAQPHRQTTTDRREAYIKKLFWIKT
jgi:hypothetical protein